MKSYAFGEIIWDYINGVSYLGGAPVNYAAHLAKAGAESHLISKIGNDEPGKKALDELKKNKIFTNSVGIDNVYPTGTVNISLENGQPEYNIAEAMSFDHITEDQIPNSFGETHVFYFGTLAQRSAVSRTTLYKILDFNPFEFVFCDLNLRSNYYSKEILEQSLNYATILKLNTSEANTVAATLFDEQIGLNDFLERCVKSFNLKLIIVTDGANGCYIYENNRLIHLPGNPIEVQDTVGAGDAFSAAFMYHYFRTRDANLAAVTANRVAEFVASQAGAIPEYTAQVSALLQR